MTVNKNRLMQDISTKLENIGVSQFRLAKSEGKDFREGLVEDLLKIYSQLEKSIDPWFESTDVSLFSKEDVDKLHPFQENRLRFYELFMEMVDLIEPMVDQLRFDD